MQLAAPAPRSAASGRSRRAASRPAGVVQAVGVSAGPQSSIPHPNPQNCLATPNSPDAALRLIPYLINWSGATPVSFSPGRHIVTGSLSICQTTLATSPPSGCVLCHRCSIVQSSSYCLRRPICREMLHITNVCEYKELAKQKLPRMVYDYYASGAEDQWTLKENREAFSRIQLRPRVLIDVSHINMSTSVLGYNVSMPIMIAPTALHKMAHPEGELASARAAAAEGTIMTLSSWSSCSIEDVNSTGSGIRFFQLSVFRDRNLVCQLIRRAEKAGYKAIVLTVDASWFGRREDDVKNRFTLPQNVVLKCFEGLDLGDIDKTNGSALAAYYCSQVDRSLSWKDIKWLQEITSLPILVKGILTAEDARTAIECGAAGIIVSNHGGRQLNYAPATISCLEEVVGEQRGVSLCSSTGAFAVGLTCSRPWHWEPQEYLSAGRCYSPLPWTARPG